MANIETNSQESKKQKNNLNKNNRYTGSLSGSMSIKKIDFEKKQVNSDSGSSSFPKSPTIEIKTYEKTDITEDLLEADKKAQIDEIVFPSIDLEISQEQTEIEAKTEEIDPIDLVNTHKIEKVVDEILSSSNISENTGANSSKNTPSNPSSNLSSNLTSNPSSNLVQDQNQEHSSPEKIIIEPNLVQPSQYTQPAQFIDQKIDQLQNGFDQNQTENNQNFENPENFVTKAVNQDYTQFENPITSKTKKTINRVANRENFENQDRIGSKHINHHLEKKHFGNPFMAFLNFLGRQRGLFSGVFAIFLILAIGVGTGGWIYISARYQKIQTLDELVFSRNEGSVVFDRNGKEMFKFTGDKRQEIVPITEIPEVMQLAIIAIEDENFYNNPDGIPWSNLAGATSQCLLSAGDNCRGGSGLSQQLIKNITGRNERTVDRKIDELLVARKFNEEVTKDDVLRLYLNWAFFGRGAYGVQEASKAFFGKTINQKDDKGNFTLTIPQACALASLVQKPTTYNTAINSFLKGQTTDNYLDYIFRKDVCIEKFNSVELKGNGKGKVIEDIKEVEKLQAEKIAFIEQPVAEIKYGHIRNFLIQQLRDKLGITEKDLGELGFEIQTTFDIDIQKQTEQIINDNTQARLIANGANNASAVILDTPTGEIVAMVGSRDFNNQEIQGEVNVATAPRQPGSSIKPYVYADAFEQGFNPGTVLLDYTTNFGGYTPKNFDSRTRGPVSMRYALQNSLNIPAVKTMYLLAGSGDSPNGDAGLSNFFSFVNRFGVDFPLNKNNRCGISTALGGCEITLLDHTAGYDTLLSEGTYQEPTPFKKVILKQKNVLTQEVTTEDIYAKAMESSNPPYVRKEAVIEPVVARQVADVLSDYTARDAGVWGSLRRNLELDGWTGKNSVAAKTGTTNDVKDTWTMGGSPYYIVGLWVGNTDGKPLKSSIASSNAAAPIWKDIMTALHKGKEKKGFPTTGLKSFGVDPVSGLPSSGGKSELLTDKQIQLLQAGAAKINNPDYDPTSTSIFVNRTPIVSRKLVVNKLDGKLIPENTDWPEEFKEEIVCGASISEFPKFKNWAEPAGNYSPSADEQKEGGQPKKPFGTCPSEFSNLSTDSLVLQIESNIRAGSLAPDPISITIKSSFPTANITKLKVVAGDQTVVELSQGQITTIDGVANITINLAPLNLFGTYNLQIYAEDDKGLTANAIVQPVEFGFIDPNLPTPDQNQSQSQSADQSESVSQSQNFKQNQSSSEF